MDILKNFGFNPVLFSAQIVNFLIILYLLNRFAFKPILKVLEDRKRTIIEAQENARKSQEELEKTLEKENAIIQAAQETSEKLINDAKKQAVEMAEILEKNGKEKVDNMLMEAKEEILRDKKKTEKELAVSVSMIAAEMVQKSLVGLLTKEEQEKIAKRAIGKLK